MTVMKWQFLLLHLDIWGSSNNKSELITPKKICGLVWECRVKKKSRLIGITPARNHSLMAVANISYNSSKLMAVLLHLFPNHWTISLGSVKSNNTLPSFSGASANPACYYRPKVKDKYTSRHFHTPRKILKHIKAFWWHERSQQK